MTKFAGLIGFIITEEIEPGVYEPKSVPKQYFGDVLRNTRRWNSDTTQINDSFEISNQVSIVADKFAYDNLSAMRWVEYLGVKWKISSVDIQYPRLVLELGGLYHDRESA